MQKILGIDLGASAIKAVAIEASFRSHAIRGYRSEPVEIFEPPAEGQPPRTWIERALPAIQAFARDGWFECDTVVCTLPGAQVAAHTLSLPFVERKQIDATLPGEIEGLTPFNLEDIVYDTYTVNRGLGKTDTLVAIAQRAQVKAILGMFQSVGVDPAVVTFSAISLSALITEGYVEPLTSAPEDPAPAVEAIVDVGAERTSILILENGEAKFARTTALGGNDVTQALRRALNVPEGDAEEAKRSLNISGAGTDPTVSAVALRTVNGLLRELRSTFASYSARTRRKVSRVRITGGGSLLGGLPAYLSEALALPVEAIHLKAPADWPEPDEIEAATLALALALRGLGGPRGPRMNFRRGDLAYAQEAGDVRGLYVGLGAMAACLLVLFCISAWARVHALEVREAQLDATLCSATKKILGTCITDYHEAIAKLQGQGSTTSGIPQTSAIGITVALSQVFPTGPDTVLDDIDINEGTVMIRGAAKSYDTIDVVVTGIRANKCFQDVKEGKTTKTADGKVAFDVEATYTCGTASGEAT